MKLLLLLITLIFLVPPQDNPHRLVIRVTGLNPLQGDLYISLHHQPELFPDAEAALMKKKTRIRQESEIMVFDKVPAGRYAVAVYHDENLNGVLDVNEKDVPLEGYGFSTKRRIMGQPKFDQAAFDLSASDTLDIKMIYLSGSQKKK
ncbi:MAG: DUF2141 domain-containing protein [Bacteroidales bacterium]|nr:DUF2141 domain-containing protein [Bacteroidales bacterium]